MSPKYGFKREFLKAPDQYIFSRLDEQECPNLLPPIFSPHPKTKSNKHIVVPAFHDKDRHPSVVLHSQHFSKQGRWPCFPRPKTRQKPTIVFLFTEGIRNMTHAMGLGPIFGC